MSAARLTTIIATLALAAAALAVAPVASAKHGDGVRVRGVCSRGSIATLKLSPEDGRIEIELEVDQNRSGVPWKVTLRRDGARIASATAVTHAPSGSFSLRRLAAGAHGTVGAVAARAGERCAVHASI
jgi:hypothetical protein